MRDKGETVSESDTKWEGGRGRRGWWVEARSYRETLREEGVKIREFLVLSPRSS